MVLNQPVDSYRIITARGKQKLRNSYKKHTSDFIVRISLVMERMIDLQNPRKLRR